MVDIPGSLPELVDEIRPIGDQAARVDENALEVNRGQLVASRQALRRNRPSIGVDGDIDHGGNSKDALARDERHETGTT